MAGDADIKDIDGLANDQGEENPYSVIAQHAQRTDEEGSTVLAEIREQGSQILEHEVAVSRQLSAVS